jgi:hypothetical protein
MNSQSLATAPAFLVTISETSPGPVKLGFIDRSTENTWVLSYKKAVRLKYLQVKNITKDEMEVRTVEHSVRAVSAWRPHETDGTEISTWYKAVRRRQSSRNANI